MLNFDFYNPTKILFGEGSIAGIAQQIGRDRKILITYGGGSIKANGVLKQVREALAGYDVLEFGGIEPNPSYEKLMEAVQLVRSEKIDFLLAVGGGSVIDGTKFIAAAVYFDGEPWDLLAKWAPFEKALPFGSVLTLPATGSEMNCGAVITRRSEQSKLFFTNPLVYPQFSVLDPTTTYSLPQKQVANGVIDSFVHVMEQYLTFPVSGMVQDRFSEGLLQTLVEIAPKLLDQPDNYQERANFMWCATLCLNGLVGAGVPQDWATHMLGHEITALHGLDHAQTLAIVLPSMMTVQKEQKRAKLLQYAERVWGMTEGDQETRIAAAIDRTRQFFEGLGVKTRLGDYGIGSGSIPTIVAQLERHGMKQLGERGDVSLEVSRKVLELSL
jgi:NADP-dependent alcohol dehydrogenase